MKHRTAVGVGATITDIGPVTALSEHLSNAGEVDVVASDDSAWFLIRQPLQNGAAARALIG